MNNLGILNKMQLSATDMQLFLKEERGKIQKEREKETHTQLTASNIKQLSVQLRSEGCSFNNDSVSCKETGRKEETEEWRGL